MNTKLFQRLGICLIGSIAAQPEAYAGTISATPLFLTPPSKSNTLVILDNSNSMDEDPTGAAVGSNSADSKSETARKVIRDLVTTYNGQINMGLMSYQQSNIVTSYLHNSPYDVSFNPLNYNANFTGARDSATKRFRKANPTSAGNFVHYNVALPFYDNNASQGNGFCYAPFAKAFNNGENPASGPWDTYKCFNTKTGTKDIWDVIPANNWGTTNQETTLGLSGLFYNGQLNPTDSDYAQGILDFGKQLTWYYVGRTFFSNTSPGRGYLNNPIRLLDATQSAALNTNLACDIPTTPAPCTANGIKNAGLTPIEGTLLTAKDYFNGSLSNTAEGFVASGANISYPLPMSCNKNFVILITDGLPSTDKTGNLVANPATAITAAANAAASLKASHVDTYVVGFALPYGTDPTTLDTIAQSGGTGAAYLANDSTTLASALDAIYKDILSKQNSFSSLANNGPKINTGSLLYQATFDATDWSGDVKAFVVNADGTLSSSPYWQASSKLPAAASRNIFTYNPNAPSLGVKGMDFLWANLTNTPTGSSQQDYLNTLSGSNDGLGQDRLNWLRGDNSKAKSNGGGFRNRVNALGDIVNSNPVYISNEDYDFAKLPSAEGSSYTAFRAGSAYTNRRPMLYMGANDGMLHGFDAQKTSTGGTEVLAYVPNSVFSQLSKLTAPNYSKQAYVDGQNTASDAYVDTDSNGAAEWHTLLTATTGAGAKALFTLDVTNPTSFGNSSVLWEYSDSNDADLGYTLTQPAIVRMHGSKWGAVVANGYNSTTGKAVLFIFDAATGAVLKKIDTGTGSTTNPNGLSTPLAVDLDSDRIVDVIYAGDLFGNLWKFDVSSDTISTWDVAYKSGTTPLPLFVACVNPGSACAAADRQPITSKPTIGQVGTDQATGLMLYFGTGKYFDTTDNIIGSNPQVQTFYGLWDKNSKIASTDQITDTTNLQTQTIDFESIATSANNIASSNKMRITSKNEFCYSATGTNCTSTSTLKRGWQLKLLSPPATATGERVIQNALLYYKTIIFATLIPSSDQCSAGGKSWLMMLDSITGQRKDKTVFDAFGATSSAKDKIVDQSDMIDSSKTPGTSSLATASNPLISSSGTTQDTIRIGAGTIMDIGTTAGVSNVSAGGNSSDLNSAGSAVAGDGSLIGNSSDGTFVPTDLNCKLAGGCVTGSGARKSWRQLR